jgi:addiction module RelE/StbE family toxin
MIYRFHKNFIKTYQKFEEKFKEKVDKKLLLFGKNPFYHLLENHRLIGEYQGYRSINITGDFRAIYKELSDKEVIFVKIGTHSQLY